MAAITFNGLASGLDTKSIISALVGVERIPLLRVESQNDDYRSKSKIIDQLSSALSSLKTSAESLGTSGDFLSYKGSVANESIAKVTTSGDSVPGSYSLEVTSLAYAQRTYSDPKADADAALSTSAQTLTLTINGEETEIDIPANTSLRGVAAAINASGAECSAGLMFDGSQYRLQVVGSKTGEDNAITFADSGLGLGLTHTYQAAADAVLSIDGHSITSASNVIDNVLPGTTLELKATTNGETSVDIAADPAGVKEKLQKFVDAYNAVAKIIQGQSGQGKGAETLNGDSTVRMIEQGLARMISSPIPGLVGPSNSTLQLTDLGIKTNRDGTLTLDGDDLDEALADDFGRAASYFAGDGTNQGISSLLGDLIDGYVATDGLLTTRKKGIADQIAGNDKRIEELQAYLDRYEESLQQKYTALESTMSELNSQTSYLARFL
ncbi:MAG TPA: flagellar filament capping protein FliD [Nannocystaceae bacterium]|nr:flagellar filament capping protein FliD [Nannocystaceae bacterium]